MYALAIIRYSKPLEKVLPVVEAHRIYLADLQEKGIVLACGPLVPRYGGALLLRLPDDNADATLVAVRDNDPFVIENVAQYELLPWSPIMGMDKLNQL